MLFFSHRIEELLLDILYSSTKMHEELKKDETESLTDVTMIQLEGLLIGKGQLT